jgi:hypothetical protein
MNRLTIHSCAVLFIAVIAALPSLARDLDDQNIPMGNMAQGQVQAPILPAAAPAADPGLGAAAGGSNLAPWLWGAGAYGFLATITIIGLAVGLPTGLTGGGGHHTYINNTCPQNCTDVEFVSDVCKIVYQCFTGQTIGHPWN